MILDRTWNKRKHTLNVSYIDEKGRRQTDEIRYNVYPTWELDRNGEHLNWDGRRIRPIFRKAEDSSPSEFDILELLYQSSKYQEYKAVRFPRIYTCDIETQISEEFPDPAKAEQEVTTISIAADDLSVIVLGIKPMSEDDIKEFRIRYIEYIKGNTFATKHFDISKVRVLYQYFPKEIDMLEHFFTKMLNKMEVMAGWNFYAFDWTYLTNRLKVLYGEMHYDGSEPKYFPKWLSTLKKASPTGETVSENCIDNKGNRFKVLLPAHVAIVDYMALIKKYDRVLDFPESFSLNWIATKAVEAQKIKYPGDLKSLYTDDYLTYVFYNAVDSLLIQLIHRRLKTLEVIYAYSSYTLCSVLRCLSPVALTTAMVFEDFYEQGRHVAYESRPEQSKEDFDGGYVKDPVVGLHEWCVCDDFASLYPSQIQTCNLSFENYMQKKVPGFGGEEVIVPWEPEELEEFRKNPDYFVSVLGHVYKNDRDYSFRRIQKKAKKTRDKYKYRGQLLESELLHGPGGIDARIKALEGG